VAYEEIIRKKILFRRVPLGGKVLATRAPWEVIFCAGDYMCALL
jgi:hypothetical protein